MFTIASFTYLTMGALFGLTAGIAPGPLLTLVITQTLKHNKSEGIKIAISPLITDLPTIIITLFVLSRFSQFKIVLGIISFLGGIFIAYLGYGTFVTKGIDMEIQNLKPGSLKKGIITNLLNPQPDLFWLTVGIPIALKAYELSLITVILFFLSFYILLIGSTISIAWIVERSRNLFKHRAYIWTMRILGIILFIFSLYFFYDGIKILRNR
jgi:threonine/homoserine/homoserine lactone efflux protein